MNQTIYLCILARLHYRSGLMKIISINIPFLSTALVIALEVLSTDIRRNRVVWWHVGRESKIEQAATISYGIDSFFKNTDVTLINSFYSLIASHTPFVYLSFEPLFTYPLEVEIAIAIEDYVL